MTFDPMDDEHQAWRARCERLAAQYLAVVDVRDVIQVDELEEQHAVVHDGVRAPAA